MRIAWLLGAVSLVTNAAAQDCNTNGIDDARDVLPQGFRFGAVFPLETHSVSGAFLFADLDRDGRVDLIAADTGGVEWNDDDCQCVQYYCGERIEVRLGAPAGGFGPPSFYPAGRCPVDLAAADLDGDGLLDVAAANADSGDVTWLRGLPAGGLEPAGTFPVGTRTLAALAGDFDGDADQDLAAGSEGAITLFKSEGGVLLPEPQRVSVAGDVRDLAAADLDGDSRPELLYAARGAKDVGGYLALTGNGVFEPRGFPLEGGGHSLRAGDLDGDGRADVALTFEDSTGALGVQGIAVLWNDGGERFASAPGPAGGAAAALVEIVDGDEDGRPDLVSLDLDAGFSFHRNEGGRRFVLADRFFVGPAIPVAPQVELLGGAMALAAEDLTRDGLPDLVFARREFFGISTVENLPGAYFAGSTNLVAGEDAFMVAGADLDLDGDVDLAVSDVSGRAIHVLENDGTGHFAPSPSIELDERPLYLLVADVDADGLPDLLSTPVGGRTISVHRNLGGLRFAGAGSCDVPARTARFAAGDLDGDGDVDLVAPGGESSHVTLLRGDGKGSFALDAVLTAGEGARHATLADLDDDGDLDLVTSDYYTTGLTVFENLGGGSFVKARRLELGATNPTSSRAADLDGDGALDLIAQTGGRVIVLWSAELEGRLSFDSSAFEAVPVDLDLDGDLDIVGSGGSTILSDGNRSLRLLPDPPVRVPGSSQAIVAADLDGDRDIDIATTDSLRANLFLTFNHAGPAASRDDDRDGIPDECEAVRFVRGDCNGDGSLPATVTDAVFLLGHLFLGTQEPPCLAACDANGDGSVGGVTDAVVILGHLFLGGPPPAPPFPDCGPGVAVGDIRLGCAAPPALCR